MRLAIIIATTLAGLVLGHYLDKWRNSRATVRCDEMLRAVAKEKYSELNFDPDRAVLLSKKDIPFTESCIETNRIYKNHNGVYFLYIGTEISRGYLAPISEERAKNALRNNGEAFEKEFPDEKY